MLEVMSPSRAASLPVRPTQALFLPLAFRLALALGLILLHFVLPREAVRGLPGEGLYLAMLGLFAVESALEAAHALRRHGAPFRTPGMGWIRANLLLDLLLVAFLIAYHGVDQERFATIYIFPVLASAFYLSIREIVGMGVVSALVHVASVLCFSSGLLPPFGHSSLEVGLENGVNTYILGFASLQIFAATLVVVLIRRHLESLSQTLDRTEARADALSTLYARVFQSMFSGIITTDLEGRVTSANPAAEGLLQQRLPPETFLEDLGIEGLTLHGSAPLEQRFERSYTTPAGERRIFGGNLMPLRDAEGQRTGNMLIFQDLTEIKALEARTQLAERLAAIGELSGGLAHELRNPLASIQGCVQILLKEQPPPEILERVLTILRRESERVGALVSNFLDFARPRPPKTEALWLPSLLEDAQASWEMDPRRGALTLERDPAPERWIQGDPICAHQVFSNLLSNARKAVRSTERPSIRLRARTEAEGVAVKVQDNGCGMDAEQLRTLFHPFHGGFAEGTGLGMSLVFQFVQGMGWDIQVDSSPGRGTTVRLLLPFAPPPA